jgi:ABC-type antimicrobial peptide transport system permease subunit
VLPGPLFEELAGDLEEQFEQHADERGLRQARLLYVLEVLAFCRPYFLARSRRRPHPYTYPNPLFSDMLINYLTVARRNLLRHKAHSAINIGGLAVGMSVALLIGLWLWDELSFDRYHRNYDRIVRVQKHLTRNNETGTGTTSPYPLAHELKTKYGAYFKHVIMAWWVEDHTLSVGDKKVALTGQFIEPGAPEMLTLDMQQGTWAGLRDPHSVMLSASAARALFGDGNPMGKALKIDNTHDVTVTGVYADLPQNTHFHPIKYFLPWDLLMGAIPAIKEQGWDNNFLTVYAELQPHADADQVSARIKDVIASNLGDNKEYAAAHPQLFLHPMRKWHLQAEWKNGVNTGGLLQYVWLFGLIGAFVLLLAAINFMNLSTARSEKRAKEVGVRKTMGSLQRQLVGQFFSESFLVVGLAFGVALLLAASFLPWFNEVAGKQLQLPLANPYFWLAGGLFVIITGLLAGSYPAFYLSSFRPMQVLKGTFRVGRLAALPRKALVVVQFTVSVTLITGTLLVYRQIEHAKNRPVGYTREGLVMMRITQWEMITKFDRLRDELKNAGVIAEAALSAHQATDAWASNGGFDWPGKDPALQTDFSTLTVTPEYGKTVGWQFVAGRDFSRDFASDSAGFVVNEAAVKYMGLQNPVGTIIRRDGKPFRILGVIKDMVLGSPFEPVQPAVFFLKGPLYWATLRIKPGVSPGRALPKMEAVFKSVLPDLAFDYQFVDQAYALKFAAEERTQQLAAVFAALAIFISCLGLFGLASFTAEQRTKEIGIRKVLGASVAGVWRLLSKEFVYLVGLACLIALPLSYYGLSRWLAQYTYRTTLTWWIFAGAGVAALLITLLTISYQAIKAALANPVKSLRNE